MVEQIKFGKNQSVLYQADYWYDSASRRTRKDITIPGQGTTRFDYVYDKLDQLIEVKENQSTIEQFTYNQAKNRTGCTAGGEEYSYTHDDNDRLLSITWDEAPQKEIEFQYDKSGFRSKKIREDDTETRYYWNAVGQLKKIRFSDDSESFYHYDWMGMREWVEDRYGNITRHYWWTPDFGGLPHVLGSVKKIQGGTETTNLIYGQGLLAREIDNTFTYFLIGDNDNCIALADDNGGITDRYEYSTFGELLSHTGSDENRILFSTEPNDEDTGLIYLRSRYYDPGVGRFVSRDNLFDFGVNLYNYCDNNAVGWDDPSGLSKRKFTKAFEKLIWKTKKDMGWKYTNCCTQVPIFIFPGLYQRVDWAIARNKRVARKYQYDPGIFDYAKRYYAGNAALDVLGIQAYSISINKDELQTGDFAFWGGAHIGVVVAPEDMTEIMKATITKPDFDITLFSESEKLYILHESTSEHGRISLHPGSYYADKIETGSITFGRDPEKNSHRGKIDP